MRLHKIILLALILIFSYFLGQSQCKIKTSTQKLKEVKYATLREKTIMAEPHADKFELLELMRNSKF